MPAYVSTEAQRQAIEDAAELISRLREESGSDLGRTVFVLTFAVRLLHLSLGPERRAYVEERVRDLLAAMYEAPSGVAEMDDKGFQSYVFRLIEGG